ncbi:MULTISPECIES: hypothetical protein [Yersinia pseudotuberculosis complex]|uniref:Transposase n=2 Tax=Yersinia pseudotuberculosis complex TaxID=1649845 RepID=A0AAX2I2P9_YERPE|nr:MULTISPECIES: hypothetical protein [Yersinia pseudotuberculosis complex]AIN14843.1 hypothetical protein DJ40_3579 [Yersinia pseudotuberculosis]AJI91369.1 hypothetical protein CH59_3580 [Yersinia pestis]AJI98117.1 hypothetical protein BZ18_2129 [Yersinia pestis Pestoides F]AJJ07080.1 hypothetical protein BZ20_3262 [Yersinia pseudotuberculosis]AJJ15185.1 hypothetical protein CH46_2409 [Yersinia pestis]
MKNVYLSSKNNQMTVLSSINRTKACLFYGYKARSGKKLGVTRQRMTDQPGT